MKSITQYINEAKQDPIAYALAEYIGCDASEIKKDGHYYTRGDEEYMVFPSEDDAYDYVANEYGEDYCNGATEDATWYKMVKKSCDNDEETMNKCFPKGKEGEPNYKEIAKVILDSEGAEWFLAGYDGQAMPLAYKDYVAYRYN